MSNEIMRSESKPVTDAELTQHLENLGMLNKLTAGEKNTFIQIAKAFNLNPFKREIHVSKYGDNMSVITGYEVYIKRAERTGQLDGWSVITSGDIKDNSLKATLTIYRKDRSHPFVWEALYSEYVQKKDGVPNKFWQKATTMIKKVAISQGFRLCFSDELEGMPYTADEMDTVTEDIKPESITTSQPKKKSITAAQFSKLITRIEAPGADIDTLVKQTMETFILDDNQAELLASAVADTQTPAQ